MASGDSANWRGTASQPAVVEWETDYAASPVVPKKAKFDIKEGDKPPDVAQKLADDFTQKNGPSFTATATGAKVVFKAEDHKYKVSCMRFTINGQTKNLPSNGATVPVGNTGQSVHNA